MTSASRARVVSGSFPTPNYQRWEPPSVDAPRASAGATVVEPVVEVAAPPQWPTADEISAIHQQAYEEGLAYGRKEGQEQAYVETRTQWEEQVQALQCVLTYLAEPLAAIDSEVESNLVELVVLIARQLVRRELKTSPGEIVAVVREALGQLPVASRKPRVQLHPDDLELVSNALCLNAGQSEWQLESNPLLTRGGCSVETDSSRIDATVEARLNATIARFLGAERMDDAHA
jgi:flagellar assembly protein FliH